ncbi:hypothetical protein AOPFMNJM_1510 [Methylobacterium jeotgali]|uniref:Uncharacterized protein n=1 Tax=Methylobacterium jeotgali TaxID=381630 RepID=A0ABQ4SVE2_9HYPH|nr:hypothetical protein AOPFMNJM_1510 [Methylobacterium jeotgali]
MSTVTALPVTFAVLPARSLIASALVTVPLKADRSTVKRPSAATVAVALWLPSVKLATACASASRPDTANETRPASYRSSNPFDVPSTTSVARTPSSFWPPAPVGSDPASAVVSSTKEKVSLSVTLPATSVARTCTLWRPSWVPSVRKAGAAVPKAPPSIA